MLKQVAKVTPRDPAIGERLNLQPPLILCDSIKNLVETLDGDNACDITLISHDENIKALFTYELVLEQRGKKRIKIVFDITSDPDSNYDIKQIDYSILLTDFAWQSREERQVVRVLMDAFPDHDYTRYILSHFQPNLIKVLRMNAE